MPRVRSNNALAVALILSRLGWCPGCLLEVSWDARRRRSGTTGDRGAMRCRGEV